MSLRPRAAAAPKGALARRGTLHGPAITLAPGVAPPRGATAPVAGYLAAYKKQRLEAPTTRLEPAEVEGVVVEAAGNYALQDGQGALWWFDNNKVVFQFRTIGPDYHVKDIGGNYVDLTSLFDFVVDAEYFEEGVAKKLHLKAQPGDRMRFVPRETSALQLKDDMLVIYDNKTDEFAYRGLVSIPSACKGVATEVRPAAVVGRLIA